MSIGMEGQKTQTDTAKTDNGVQKSPLPTDVGELTDNKSIDTQSKSEPAQQVLAKSYIARFFRYPCYLWDSLRSPEVSNRVIAVATIVIAIAAGLTWWETHGAGEQTDKVIAADERVANAMERAVGQANDAFTGTVNQSRLDQRAWVGVSDSVTTAFSIGNPWTVSVIFFNSGRTPARNVQASVRYRLSREPISGPNQGDIEKLVFYPVQSIAPQGRFAYAIGYSTSAGTSTPDEMTGNLDISSRFNDIKSQKLQIYYFGILKYDDVFGNHRETQYCIFLANPVSKQVANCRKFNDLN